MTDMSNPLSIQSDSPVAGTVPAVSPAARVNAQGGGAPTKPAPLFVNPDYRFDPTLGLVVMEFHDSAGTVTNTIPSQRQLEAYRTHQQTMPGERPTGSGDVTPVTG